MSGTLYIVGTPIGNLGDITPRALKTLEAVDFIAAEDTRVTVKLLNHFEIKKPLVSYYEHNKEQRGPSILARLLEGESCALVSDAGMPSISDPGEDLVRLCSEHNIPVVAVPGPSAVITALAVSGMSAGRFAFEGFLSMNKRSRREHLDEIKNDRHTLVFYEAPHKLASTLRDLEKALGNRQIAIVRELTKLHEEVIRTTLSDAVAASEQEPFRGEIVLIVAGKEKEEAAEEEYSIDDAVCLAKKFQVEGLSASAAAKLAAEQTGQKKGNIYKILAEH